MMTISELVADPRFKAWSQAQMAYATERMERAREWWTAIDARYDEERFAVWYARSLTPGDIAREVCCR